MSTPPPPPQTSGKCSMEVSRLIAEVHRRPELWDRQHPLHHNRSVLDHHWESVADLLGITGKAARGKWKNLKDHFRKEYKRCVTGANGDQEMSRWPYFYPMMFIREQIAHAAAGASAFLSDFQYHGVCPGITGMADAEKGTAEWAAPLVGPGDRGSPPPDDGGDDDDDGYRPLNCLHVEYGDRWCAAGPQRDEDFSDDKHFLLSLLPMFSTLAPDKKLRARIAIETSLLNIAYPDLTVQRPSGRVGDGCASPKPVAAEPAAPDDVTTPDTTETAATATPAAVVTATATCTAVKTGSKKRKSESDPRLQKKTRKCC